MKRNAEVLRRASAAALVALTCALGALHPALAADAPAKAKAAAPALPDPLTKETAREALSRMTDQQVRELLLEQLDRAAAAQAKPSAPSMSAMGGVAGMAGMVGENAGRAHALYQAVVALPATSRDLVARLMNREGDVGPWVLAGYLLAMLMVGWLVERLYDYALRNYRSRVLHAAAQGFSARAFQLAVGLALDLGGIAVFGLGAVAVVFAASISDKLQRVFVLLLVLGVVVVRISVLAARFLLAPETGQRLLPFADAPARTLRWFAIALGALYALSLIALDLLPAMELDPATIDLIRIDFWFVGLVLLLTTTWLVRRPIADLIRGDRSHSTVRGWIGDLWPIGATAYFLALFAGAISGILAGTPGPVGRGFASVVALIVLPILDMVLCRALAAAAAPTPDRPPGFLTAYEPIFRRAIHIVVVVAGLLYIAGLWDLDLFHLAQASFGGKIASSLLGISIVLLAAYLLWEIAKTAIDRRLAAEGERKTDVPASRLRTLLPILRATILVTIAVMAAMSVLAALGVDILPLLAGASVVGIAIGFGSQTLVRDVVSGAFFLMDDAFRLGEYIEVGDAKGVVEKINVRSVFLRHHRGALNILPYGEIKRLRNTSRDWQVHVMEFRLTYDTSMLQVKKIMKKIGDELAADPDYSADLLTPLKSGGVIAAEDSAVVVRAKFTARPGNNAWVVRRVAYDKIIRAFREAGIRFAHREVTVNTSPGQEAAASAAAGAAVAAIEGARKAQS